MKRFRTNISWLAAGRIFQLVIGATIGVLVARHLSPAAFGRLNYVYALVGLFTVVVPLGLPSVLIRELVRDPKSQERYLGSTSLVQLISGLVVYVVAMAVAFALNPHDNTLVALTAVFGLTMLAKPGDLYRTWFQSKVNSQHVVRMEMTILVLASAAKILAIFANAGIWTFVIIQTVSVAATSAGVVFVYRRVSGHKPRLAWEPDTVKRLLGQSWPLIISQVGLVLYLKIDQVMLGQMASDRQVGIYSAALRLSEVWYTVPVILMDTLFPALVSAHERDSARYRARVKTLLDVFAFLSISIAVFVWLTSDQLVLFIYGPAYAGAGPVLALHIWSAVFIFFGTATGKWYLLAGIRQLNIFRNFLGAGIDIVLNFWAIPAYGAWGAALTTLISYIFANYLADIMTQRARPLFWLKTESLLLWPRILWKPRARLAQLRMNGK